MARNNRFVQFKNKRAKSAGPSASLARSSPTPLPRQAPKRYGPPFVLLEDGNKNTFEFQRGAWIPHAKTVAECRVDCLVKQLPQKINGMTRYEIRCELP